MMKILLTGLVPSMETKKYMEKKGFEIIAPGKLNEMEILEKIKDVVAYIPGGEEKVTRKILLAGTNLKLISFCGVGYEYYIDIDAAKENNIAVTYVPNGNSVAVAEFTVTLILILMKNIIEMNENTKKYVWNKYCSADLLNKTVGIIGFGRIGKLVAKILHDSFGCNILYYNKSHKSDIDDELPARFCDIGDLCAKSDIITIHLPYTSETDNILNKTIMEKIKPGSILVNTSRAELVDPIGLKKALLDNKLRAAAFDCYYGGQVPINKSMDRFGLLELPNSKFIITPHVAYNTPSSNAKVEQLTFKNIIDYMLTGHSENRVI